MAFHSNLGSGKYGYLGLVVKPTAYSIITNTPFFHQVYPGNLVIPILSTPHAQEELKFQYEKNLRVFHGTRGVEQVLIQ